MAALLIVLLTGIIVTASVVVAITFLAIKYRPTPAPDATPAADDDRERLQVLATLAANDESGRHLLALIQDLERRTQGAPVTVSWLARRTAKDDGKGFLVKIAWDGNEWRRALDPAPLRASLEAILRESPGLASGGSARLLANLEAAEKP